jgi:hypothetical protein
MKISKTINWDLIIKKVQTQPWASALINLLREDFNEHRKLWPIDPPLDESAWGHYYFCSDCGARLNFKINEPHKHSCPKCNKAFSGYPYDGAWCKIMHSTIVTNMERAAILAHMTDADKKYQSYIHDTILFYALNYDKYPVHGKHAGKGKVYPQVLSEAIFVISIERILRMCADLSVFNEAEYNAIGQLFFLPALNLIKPQINAIQNIHAWMQSSVAACGSFLGDKAILEESIYSEFGWLNQLEKGVSKEGIWYEISDTYHYYSLNAFLSLAWIALENDIDLFKTPSLQKMAANYISFAYPDGRLPAWNDGWFGSDIFSTSAVYEQLSVFNPSYGALLSWMYENMPPKAYAPLNALFNDETKPTGYTRSSLAALLYGPVDLPKATKPLKNSFLYEDTGIAVLQNENIRISFKFSKNGGGHDHNDKNSIEFYANDEYLSYDPGTTGYGIPFTADWCRTSLAHNMVCINYQRQKNSSAKLLNFNDKSVSASADEAYDGVFLKREIKLKDNGFDDIFTVQCKEPSQMDWIFHCKGQPETDLKLESAAPFTQENGYNMLFDLQQAVTDRNFNISFITEKQKLNMKFEGAGNTQIIIGKCFGSNKTDILSFVMLRRYGVETVFSQNTAISLLNK